MSYQLAVIIPSYFENGLYNTLHSLNKSVINSGKEVAVIVVLNQKEGVDLNVDQFHRQQVEELERKKPDYAFNLHVIWEKDIPEKKAGVGYARKLGMDRAAKLLTKDSLPMVNLDADCTVDADYCTAWIKLFEEGWDSATMHFEHPFEGLSENEKEAIIQYEIHLRYYFRAQQYIGYPNAIQPIGSCMGVTKGFYKKIGGMNSRKAGEDFYFLQKCVLNGSWTYSKLTTVYPQARMSERVPFGTGKAMRDLLISGSPYKTCNWKSFLELQKLVEALKAFAGDPDINIEKQFPDTLREFLKGEELEYNLRESVEHTSSHKALEERLFRWFTPFKLMKALHYLRDHHYPDEDVLSQANHLFEAKFGEQFYNEEELLQFMRKAY